MLFLFIFKDINIKPLEANFQTFCDNFLATF